MFSRTSSQDVKTRAKAGAKQAEAQAIRVQGRALQAKEQFTPLAKSAQLTASQGVYQARAWAAPRVEQAGVAVQERIAPKVSSAMMAATAPPDGAGARPAPPPLARHAGRDRDARRGRRRRWPAAQPARRGDEQVR